MVKDATKAKRGRKSIYTEGLADLICKRLGDGESLNKICKEKEMPDNDTVHRWIRNNKDFYDKYARAREVQAETYFDQIVNIADDSGFDARLVDGLVVIDNDAINRARLRVDARKWVAARLAPKKYGDRLQTENHTTHDASDNLTALMAEINGTSRAK